MVSLFGGGAECFIEGFAPDLKSMEKIIENILKARDVLDKAPVPYYDRIIWDAEKGVFIKGPSLRNGKRNSNCKRST